VSGIFVPKIIRIWSLVFKLWSKMSGMFFETVYTGHIVHCNVYTFITKATSNNTATQTPWIKYVRV